MAKLLFFVLTSAILMNFGPMSQPMSAMPTMQTMRMEELKLSHQSNSEQGNMGENSTRSCCDEIAPFSVGCAFLVPELAGIDFAEGGKQVLSTNLVVQSISIETVTPPPRA